jgi:hypothetical protein
VPEYNTFLELLSESRGRTRIVDMGRGNYQFQDPDYAALMQRPDGSTFVERNVFIGNAYAVEHLAYNYDLGFVADSFGTRVPLAALAFPKRGTVVEYKTLTATWKPLDKDPRQFKPNANQEIVERVIFMDGHGNLQTLDMSYGKGKKYDRSKTGEKWRYFAGRMAGEEEDPGAGNRLSTRELQKNVVSREFLVKEMTPRPPTVTGE